MVGRIKKERGEHEGRTLVVKLAKIEPIAAMAGDRRTVFLAGASSVALLYRMERRTE